MGEGGRLRDSPDCSALSAHTPWSPQDSYLGHPFLPPEFRVITIQSHPPSSVSRRDLPLTVSCAMPVPVLLYTRFVVFIRMANGILRCLMRIICSC
jgi:hypothetical protein